ncbi:MAG: hypothetical protein IJW29_00995 [Clostridia bacterium]|nr:hypothetical protein [Clostridia bacterium]
MAKASKKIGRYAALRVRAGEVLSRDGNRLTMIGALAVCFLFVALYATLGYCMAALSLLLNPVILTVIFAASVYFSVRLLVAPTVLGLFYMAMQMTRGEETVLADFFHFLGTRKLYRFALRVTRPIVYLLADVAIAAVLTYAAFASFTQPTLGNFALCALTVAAEIVAGVLLLCRHYARFAIAVRCDESLTRADLGTETRRLFRAPTWRGFRFLGSFLGWLLLGLLTVGLLWVADTLPRMLVAYCLDCTPDQQQ